MSAFIVHGVEQLKSILTTYNPSNDDERTKYDEPIFLLEGKCFIQSCRFDAIHKQFTSVTRELEQLIGAYVNVMFSKTKRTHEGLTILASFEPVCERHHLRSILRDAYVNLFLSKFTMN